ncbi:MAG: hypothetical protein JWL63_303 [Rhodocyclales bacterium]|nr:hypothetical protein [Rhodocyclales bacterium]
MGKPVILMGDKTDHGGVVIEGAPSSDVGGKRIARVGDKVTCPKKGCHSPTVIVTGDSACLIDGKAVARHGDKTACGATLLASQILTTDGGPGGDSSSAAPAAATAAAADTHANPETPHKFDEKIRFVTKDGAALTGVNYVLTLGNGKTVSGTTDATGHTERVATDSPQTVTKAELTPSKVFCCAAHAEIAASTDSSSSIDMPLANVQTNPTDIGSSVVTQTVEMDVRGLTPGEIEMARKVFKDSLDYGKVKIHKGGLLGVPASSKNAMTPMGEIHFPPKAFQPDYSTASTQDAMKVLFIHEMTHVWQYQMGYSVWFNGVVISAKGGYAGGAPAYNYDAVADAGKSMPDFNMEQQGNLVAHYFDASYLAGNDAQHRRHVADLAFFQQVLANFLRNPSDVSLLPNTTHIER